MPRASACTRPRGRVPQGVKAACAETQTRRSEKASYYSAVCLETGTVAAMPLASTSNAATSVTFLQPLRAAHPEPLIVIWDNGPAHRGEAIRTYLATPDLHIQLVALPAYSPDYNADEAIWKWARAEVTANTCWGTAGRLRAELGRFFDGAVNPAKLFVSAVIPTLIAAAMFRFL